MSKQPDRRRDIGSHNVIRHAYENVLNACARLSSFAIGRPTISDGPINKQQELLAIDDLVAFAIHARRLIENTISFETVQGVIVENTAIPITRIMNIIVHHKNIEVVRTNFQLALLLSKDPIDVLVKYSDHAAVTNQFSPLIFAQSEKAQRHFAFRI